MNEKAERAGLLEWMRANADTHATGMRYREAALAQMCFFRDIIAPLFYPVGLTHEERNAFCKIEGWHTSKSVRLPVYYIATALVEIVARDNFHGWNVTVRSAVPLDLPAYFEVDADSHYLFMEGMEHWREGLYQADRRRFSLSIGCKYDLYAIMRCVASQVRAPGTNTEGGGDERATG